METVYFVGDRQRSRSRTRPDVPTGGPFPCGVPAPWAHRFDEAESGIGSRQLSRPSRRTLARKEKAHMPRTVMRERDSSSARHNARRCGWTTWRSSIDLVSHFIVACTYSGIYALPWYGDLHSTCLMKCLPTIKWFLTQPRLERGAQHKSKDDVMSQLFGWWDVRWVLDELPQRGNLSEFESLIISQF